MPAPLNVPVSQRPAILELAKLTEDGYKALRQCVSEARLYSDTDALIEETSKAVSTHTALGGQIFATVIGLRTLLDHSGMSVSQVVSGVAADAEAKNYVGADYREVLAKRLSELLETRTVTISAKAYSLLSADSAPFNDVRIVSDVRPIFSGKDELMEFSGSMIVHNLRIEVSGEGEDLHSTLATSDLLKLKRTVERALEKDRRLREALRGSPLAPLESSDKSSKER